ncbi:uncharacterized protein LOC144745911 isoform X2 [Ciona intestinalis]
MAFNLFITPPSYSPTGDITDFLALFNSYCESVKASEEVKRHLFISTIDNELKWQIQGKDPCIFKLPYKTIVERAIAVINGTPHREKTRSELFTRQQKRDESKREFVYALKHLGSRAYADEEETSMRNEVLYLALVHGLVDKELANSIPKKIGYSRDFCDAAELVINSESSSQVLEVAPIANVPKKESVTKHVDTTREDLITMRLELENMKRMLASSGTSRVGNVPTRPTPTAGRECFSCGQYGHIRRFCPNLQPRVRNSTISDNVVRNGHFNNRESYSRMHSTGRNIRADSARKEIRTKRTGNEETVSLYRFTNVMIGNMMLPALVDTGSAVTLLHYDKYMDLKPQNGLSPLPPNVKFVGANGRSVTVLGKTKLTLVIGGLKTLSEVYVARDISYDFILGLDFLQQNHCRLCYRSNLMSTPKSSVPLLSKPYIPECHEVCVTEKVEVPAFTENSRRLSKETSSFALGSVY